jgi:hypothetical protein
MNRMVLITVLGLGMAGAPAIAQQAPDPFGPGHAVADTQLRTITGMADVAQAIMASNTSNVSNNQVNGNSTTGTISFDPASFQNMNGLSVLSANTGNNVSINSSLNVNVAIRP